VRLHVYPAAAKTHTFSFQAQALFNSRVPAEFDFTASAEHALPWQTYGAT
jgi:hypothetical protein